MKRISNVELLNSIRASQTEEYKNIIPQVTSQDEVVQLMATFAEYPTAKNAFVGTLTNKIGKAIFFDKAFNNPYKMLHRGMLEYGKSIEQLFVEMAEQKAFTEHFSGSTTGEGDLIKPLPPAVKVDYISENYQYKFKTSISDAQLKGAFMSEYGLQDLILHAVNSLSSAVNYSEYADMKELLNTTLAGQLVAGGLTEQVAEDGKEIAKKLRALSSRLTFPTDVYNLAGVRNWSKKEDLVFFTTPEIIAELDVEVLASAFNISCAEVGVRVIAMDEMPQAGGKDIIGILADRDLIQCYDTINTTATFYNGEQLTTNYFAHKHGLMCGCQFAQAVVLVK